jgi:hypothetical protein
MNGEFVTVGDGVKPVAKMLESVIGTVTVGRNRNIILLHFFCRKIDWNLLLKKINLKFPGFKM